ncbi:MAG: LytTR family DNA-binding domain-containing protein [Bacteroidota bacterium]
MIKAIALDDEPPALQVIQNFCDRLDYIDLQKTFTRSAEAIKYMENFPVDLLFLDINMPSVNGIDLYKSLVHKPTVIFTTAYSEFAVEGFTLNAIDYLLKPFTWQRFLAAAEKAKEYTELKKGTSKTGQEYLFIRVDYSLVKISLSDILFIEGLDDYLKINLQNQKPLVVRMTLKTLLEELPSAGFVRVHRSYIVPLGKIESVRNKTINIAGEEIPVGKSYEENFLANFNKT